MKIKFLKLKKNYRKENFKVNPDIYWEATIVLALLLMIVSFIFAYNLFREINKEDNPIVGNNSFQTGNKEKTRIEDALKYFSLRAEKSTEILNSPAPVIDPAQ